MALPCTIYFFPAKSAAQKPRLINRGLVLALGAVEAGEASAGTGGVVAQASAGTVSAGLVTIAVQRIRTRRTLYGARCVIKKHYTCKASDLRTLELARWPSVSGVTIAAHVLHGVPWNCVCATSFRRQMLLRPAAAAVIAVVGANCALAGHSFVPGEARAQTSGSVAETLIRALCPRVQVICANYGTDPCEVLRTSSQRAIWSGPFGFSRRAVVAQAIIIHLTSSVSRTVVLAQTSRTSSSFIVNYL